LAKDKLKQEPKERGQPKRSNGAEKEYLEFGLDAKTLSEVEALAQKANCTPFEMCVILLQEQISLKSWP
jgi:hypothetical protein